VTLAEIAAGFEAIKAGASLIQTLSAASTEAKINEIKIGLQDSLLKAQAALSAAQTAQIAAADRVRDLEQKIVKLKDWASEKQRYELKGIDFSAFAYIPKPGMENGEAPHWLCTNCFEEGHRSVLQAQKNFTGPGAAKTLWKCNRCKGELAVDWFYAPTKPWTAPAPNDAPM
jgi:hypothetical protein